MNPKASFPLAFLKIIVIWLVFLPFCTNAQGVEGYYRFPSVHDNTVVFTAEGDIWKVNLSGGLAQRLTTHAQEERNPVISPDGTTLAFTASYEGPREVYTMPLTGGLPHRWTYEGETSMVNGWTPDGKIVYDTRAYSTLPDRQLVTIDLSTKVKQRIPLSQASEATFNQSGNTVFFVRPAFHGNVTKRYKGGTARQIWKYTEGDVEAVKLTTDYIGESHHPMWFQDRVYFISDRDGIMNLWSMDDSGADLQQHTSHKGFDVRTASLHQGNIVYQLGADLRRYHIANGDHQKINIRLPSDLDQLREKWDAKPTRFISSVEPSPKGDKIVVTARGRLFVFPTKTGRMVDFTHKKDVRFRDAVFSHDGKKIITLSDETGEFEFVRLPANGIGSGTKVSSDGKILRFRGIPSPDGKWIAYDDLDANMYVLNVATGVSRKISNNQEGIRTFSWSPDSKWMAFVQNAYNTMAQIFLHELGTGATFPITTDRANSLYPQWSPDGKFIYFLSDRSFTTLVGSPWGTRQPEPYFDASEKLYYLPLQTKNRSPFRDDDELKPQEKDKTENDNKKESTVTVTIDRNNIQQRIIEVPVDPGNYANLGVTDKAIYLTTRETGVGAKTHLGVIKITNDDPKVKNMVEDISNFRLAADGEKILVAQKKSYYMIDASTEKVSDLDDHKIELKNWKFPITPREDWKQIFTDAWRMERDYFYDKNMHGVDWNAMYDKYLPLVDRILTREELSDLIGRFVGELAALHTSVRGGDVREDPNQVFVARLGGRFSRDVAQGGFRIDHIYKADPDYPHERSPLDQPFNDIRVGDVITQVNGQPALPAVDIGALIRNQTGKQVRLTIKRGTANNDFIVVPIGNAYTLRYRDWQYSRRLEVERQTQDQVGYIHLQGMGSRDLNHWYREFYPVFDRPGLIIDVRHNGGGNIESFILEKLLRKAWMYWKGRTGIPYSNMQYAFRGHIVILVNERTASDGEAFADGFKRLNLGTAIGTRTWGGEIWLSGVNRLTDGGIARAPMYGVYGPEGEWLIEGHGFEPDIVVDNLPHSTFNGEDAQLKAAIDHLLKLIEEDPRELPAVPEYPDKSFNNGN
ncbi:MAG: S41 family peptidase [Cyclobacteriaceae bacterium]|nr:S41 family peptidase [Cyclobacteriaceae bacterium]